ncbi:MAG: tRNA lysidine(34) synthetase TilS [Ruminococcaceae bacterium]|nr:tRNA lysidine(34) synthetase TilS [Oscillospiraceae bacterium]
MTRLSADTLSTPQALAGVDTKTPILLALSGGMDSAALLDLLADQARREGFPITVAHFHHGIRGEEADRDAAFCEGLAKRYGASFATERANVPQLAREWGVSTETAARKARYAFLERVMEERQIPLLITAHHGNDNLETVLFRLCRGTGLTGLCGIPSVRSFGIGLVVRPLLPYSREELAAYCAARGLSYVTDSTNLMPDCSRNRLRLQVIPQLEGLGGDLSRSVWRMTRGLERDRDLLETLTNDLVRACRTANGLNTEALRNAHPSLRIRAMARIFPTSAEAVHFEAAERLLLEGKWGASVALPGGLSAVIGSEELTVIPDIRESDPALPRAFSEGAFSLCDGRLTVSVRKSEKCEGRQKIHNLSTAPCINFNGISDIMIEQLQWRARKAEDRILWQGRTRSIRRLYRLAGVPEGLRQALPVLCAGEELLWIPYVGVSDRLLPFLSENENNNGYECEVVVHGWSRSANDPQGKED